MVVDSMPEVDNLKTAVGGRIKAARSRLGLTQKELCALVDMPLPSLRHYELAKRLPGGDAIASLMRAGISANWLLTGEGQMLLSDLVPMAAPKAPAPRINVDCLEAIIEGTLRVAPNAPVAALAEQIASVYKGFIDKGLITPEGEQGSGNLSQAA